MLQKIVLLSLSLITSAQAMDSACPKSLVKTESAVEAAHELPDWVRKAASVTVILERGYFTNTTAIFPIDDDTTVGDIRKSAVSKLSELLLERASFHAPFKKAQLVACFGSAKTLYLYSYQSNPLRYTRDIKKVMEQYNTSTFALIIKQ